MTVKVWTLLITALLLVTGCSKSEVVTTYEQEVAKQEYVKQQPAQQEVNNNPVPIIFDASIGEQATTRAAVSSKADLATEGFSVFAYYTGQKYFPGTNGGVNEAQWRGNEDPEDGDYLYPNMMYNQHVTGVVDELNPDNVTWSYNPLKYWPNNLDDKVSFFAYGTHVDLIQQDATGRAGAKGNNAGITYISGNAYNKGAPIVTYSLSPTSGYVEMGDMEDLLYANNVNYTRNKEKPALSAAPITFNFHHALAAFGFGVCGVFNEVDRGEDGHTSSDYRIYDDSYIRIEDIYITAVLPISAELDLGSGAWTVAQNGAGADLTAEVEFHFDARNIAGNLRYYPYGADLDNYAGEDREAYIAAQTTVAAQNLSYGVGRYKYTEGEVLPAGFDLNDGAPIPNSGDNAIYQKVGLTGSAQQNLFYFIPASSTGDITFNFTITYHTLTSDSRMLYGIGDVKNVVSNKATISVDGGDDANSKIYMFNLQLGMTKVKINSVSNINTETKPENTPWGGGNPWKTSDFYYIVPRDD